MQSFSARFPDPQIGAYRPMDGPVQTSAVFRRVKCVDWFIWDARKGCVPYLFSIVRLVHRLVEKLIP